jgi:hypothetical protein
MKVVSRGKTIARELKHFENAVRTEDREPDGDAGSRRALAEKRGVFQLHLRSYLSLFNLIGEENDGWRLAVARGEEEYSPEADAAIKDLYQKWLSLSDRIRQKMEFYGRHGAPFEKQYHTDLRLYTDEAGRVLGGWKRPTRQYSLAELLAGVTPDNLHPEIKTGPPVGGEACY